MVDHQLDRIATSLIALLVLMEDQNIPIKRRKAFVGIWFSRLYDKMEDSYTDFKKPMDRIVREEFGFGNSLATCLQAFSQSEGKNAIVGDFKSFMESAEAKREK